RFLCGAIVDLSQRRHHARRACVQETLVSRICSRYSSYRPLARTAWMLVSGSRRFASSAVAWMVAVNALPSSVRASQFQQMADRPPIRRSGEYCIAPLKSGGQQSRQHLSAASVYNARFTAQLAQYNEGCGANRINRTEIVRFRTGLMTKAAGILSFHNP